MAKETINFITSHVSDIQRREGKWKLINQQKSLTLTLLSRLPEGLVDSSQGGRLVAWKSKGGPLFLETELRAIWERR